MAYLRYFGWLEENKNSMAICAGQVGRQSAKAGRNNNKIWKNSLAKYY